MRRVIAGLVSLSVLVVGLPLLSGCASGEAGKKGPKGAPAVVSIAQAVEKENLEEADFTGRTEAVESVDVKARATGYLQEVLFKDGDLVEGRVIDKKTGKVLKDGTLLYQIDDSTYKAELAKYNGQIKQVQASLDRYSADLARARRMRMGDAISREDYDKTSTSRDEAAAQLESAKASAKKAELDLSFTKVWAPITGVISKTRVTKGNLVTQDQTLLTNIVMVDPIRATFDVDERSVLMFQQSMRQKKMKSYKEGEFPVYLGTQIEKGFPHRGIIDFVDNQLNPSTGTLRVRGVFPNKDRVLSPGMFVRIRLPLGQSTRAIMVTERALGSNQGQRFVYVVDEKTNKVEERSVEAGALRDGMRVIESGLKSGEWVIVNGLQRVRPGSVVEPNKVPMPAPVLPTGSGKAQGK